MGVTDVWTARVTGDLIYVLHGLNHGELRVSAVGLEEKAWSLTLEELGGDAVQRYDQVSKPLAVGTDCIYVRVSPTKIVCIA